MKNNNYGLTKLLASGLAVVGLTSKLNSNVIIRTVPEQNVVVADGVTEYKMDVRADTTQEINKQINVCIWFTYVPDQVSFVDAQLPD
ncbi:TPA: hypothetical protein ENS27_10980, partial [bacterium]|nr:hypothetical protein [bacterium]